MRDLRLRAAFDEVAEVYDRVRPNYPEELFDALVQATRVDVRSKLLEIAPGTGQATLSLARRGFDIAAIEIGARLADVARRNLSDFPSVRVFTNAFEEVQISDAAFDLVYVATAFHWISPDSRFSKPHRILRPNGYFAIITASHISDGDDRFFEATQPLYRRFFPDPPGAPSFLLTRLDDLIPHELDEDLFQLVAFDCFPRTIVYSTEDYCALLSTESDKLALSPHDRSVFLGEMAKLINSAFNGVATRRYANCLTVAKKV